MELQLLFKDIGGGALAYIGANPWTFLTGVCVLFFVWWLAHPVLRAWSTSLSQDHVSEMTYFDPNEKAENARKKGVLASSSTVVYAKKPFPSLFDKPTVTLSLIVPAYNEQVRLPVMMDETLDYLEKRCRRDRGFSYEVIVVDDGSRDNTAAVALDYSRKFTTEKVRLLKLHENHGKGGAVRKGMMRARGKHLLMVDADGATQIKDLENLEKYAEAIKKNDLSLVVGSRHHLMLDAVAQRTALRNALMFGFHFYVSIMCAPGINDTQCGFKLFSRKAAQKLFPSQHIERWAFDVELLYLANKQDIPIAEVGVDWQEISGSKVNLFSSIPQMARDILTIRLCYMFRIWSIKRKPDVRHGGEKED